MLLLARYGHGKGGGIMLKRFDGTNMIDVGNVKRNESAGFTNASFVKRFDGVNWIQVWPTVYFTHSAMLEWLKIDSGNMTTWSIVNGVYTLKMQGDQTGKWIGAGLVLNDDTKYQEALIMTIDFEYTGGGNKTLAYAGRIFDKPIVTDGSVDILANKTTGRTTKTVNVRANNPGLNESLAVWVGTDNMDYYQEPTTAAYLTVYSIAINGVNMTIK